MAGLKILFTNNTLAARAGSELWVRDMALALRRRGHYPIAYSTVLGAVAEDLRDAGITVIDDLDRIKEPIDLLHLHHHLEAMTAILRFSGVPAVFVCHGAMRWEEEPLRHPRIRRWIAVDEPCRDRILRSGVSEQNVRTLYNFVDTERFARRPPLPRSPRRALVFSNQVDEEACSLIRRACESEGIAVDCAGLRIGNVTNTPESILRQYDIVFAKARAAVEAMSVGCAVILCDAAGIGPYVQSSSVAALRRLNFGFTTLTDPLTAESIRERIRRYDSEDAGHASDWIRSKASLQEAVLALEDIHHEALSEIRPDDPQQEGRAAAEYMRRVSAQVKSAEGERESRIRAVTETAVRQAKIDTRDRTIAAMRTKLFASAASIRELKSALRKETARVSLLSGDRDALRVQQQELQTSLRELTAELRKIHGSRLWRFGGVYWSLRERLLYGYHRLRLAYRKS